MEMFREINCIYPFVSISVPVYNDEDRIGPCIKSLLNQNYPQTQYEILIVDNGSNDNSREIVRKYPVKLLIEDKIQGSYAARNKGIKHTKGEILAFTDSDCQASPDWLSSGVKEIISENACLVGGKIKMFYLSTTPNLWEYFDSSMNFDQERYINDYGYGATANLFVKKRAFQKYGYFRNDLLSGGDYEFGRRLSNAGEKLVYSKSAMIFHPARYNVSGILSKYKRVSKGHKKLLELGLLEHSRINWRNFVPPKNIPKLDAVNLSTRQKMILFTMIWFMKYYYLIYRYV